MSHQLTVDCPLMLDLSNVASQHVELARAIRLMVENGELAPGDKIPSSTDMAKERGVSPATVRLAYRQLVAAGLVRTVQGSGTYVREPRPKVVRHATERYPVEKLRAAEREPAAWSETIAEMDADLKTDGVNIEAAYSITQPTAELARTLGIRTSARVVERTYLTTITKDDHVMSAIRSFIPYALLESNPELLDESNEPFPGGTIRQFRTVGIEIAHIRDEITARTATSDDAALLGVETGEPIVVITKICYDKTERVVELAISTMPGSSTVLRYDIDLPMWEDNL